MKKLAVVLCLSALTTGAFAQGFVNFFNTAGTLVSSGPAGNTATLAAGNPGAYYFGLLTSASGNAGSFTFAGVYATNQTFAGRFTGGGGVTVAGWGPGVTMSYEVAGWSANLGATFNSSWLTTPPTTPNGFFGISGIGSGQAGGSTAAGSFPNLNLFGGTGLTSGFNLSPTSVPEPASMALAGLGAAALLIFRRRK
jgi:hypothetical protein